jgi:hypothetical protein
MFAVERTANIKGHALKINKYVMRDVESKNVIFLPEGLLFFTFWPLTRK